MTELYLTYDEHSWGGDSLSDDPWSEREPSYTEWSPQAIYSKREDSGRWLVETLEVDDDVSIGDTVHLVVVRYSTGDTFGTSSGEWSIVGVYTDANEAVDVRTSIYNGKYSGYTPWEGYFESIEDVTIFPLVVY